jgi:hypothetical protein
MKTPAPGASAQASSLAVSSVVEPAGLRLGHRLLDGVRVEVIETAAHVVDQE